LLSRYSKPWYAKMRPTDYNPDPVIKKKKLEEGIVEERVERRSHKKHHKHYSNRTDREVTSGIKSIEELRKEKQEREQNERERIAKLLALGNKANH